MVSQMYWEMAEIMKFIKIKLSFNKSYEFNKSILIGWNLFSESILSIYAQFLESIKVEFLKCK